MDHFYNFLEKRALHLLRCHLDTCSKYCRPEHCRDPSCRLNANYSPHLRPQVTTPRALMLYDDGQSHRTMCRSPSILLLDVENLQGELLTCPLTPAILKALRGRRFAGGRGGTKLGRSSRTVRVFVFVLTPFQGVPYPSPGAATPTPFSVAPTLSQVNRHGQSKRII